MSEVALLILIPRSDSPLQTSRLEALKRLSEELSAQNIRSAVIGLRDSDKIHLRQTGVYLFEEDFEQEPFMQGVNDDAFKTAGSWYLRKEIAEALEIRGIPAASLIQHPFTYFLLAYLRDAALLHGLLNHYGVTRIGVFKNSVYSETSGIDLAECLHLLRPSEGTEKTAVSAVPDSRLKETCLQGMWQVFNFLFNMLLAGRSCRIFICSDLKHCDTVIPHLFKNPAVRLTLLRQKAGVRFWRLSGRYLMGMKFLPQPSVPQIDESLWARFDNALSRSDVFMRNGVDLWPLMRTAFRDRLFSRLQPLAALCERASEFFKKEKTTALLFDEDVTPYNKALALASRKLGIPSLVIQHGAPFRTVPIALAPVTASRIAAWGVYSRDLLRSWGVSDRQVSLTGVPRYDGFEQSLTREEEARQKVKRDLAAGPDQKIVVLATDPFHEDGRADFVGHYLSRENTARLLDTVFKAVELYRDVCLVVKLHPRDPHESFTRQRVLNSGLKDRVKLLRLYSTPDLLLACDILMTPCSTVAIEAMMLLKPVITINLEGGRDLQPHAETGASIGARDLESLRSAMDGLLHDSKFRREQIERALKVIPQYLTRPDGGSSRRVAEELLELVKSHHEETTR